MLQSSIANAKMSVIMESLTRFFVPPAGSFFLLGPRGTGKTTWLRESLPDALFINLLRPELYRELAARPERLRDLVLGSPDRGDIVVDEVQRVPELLNVIHDLIESDGDRRFVLTGSSARKLRRGGIDLLAGRAVVRSMHPFLAAELEDFDLASSLNLGMVPLVVAAQDSTDTLSAYASLYLEQEVRVEGLARDVGQFARFLEAISFSQAAPINVSGVARDTQANQKTVAGYVEVLEDLLLAYRVPVFTRRARRKLVAHPKFFYFDCGVFRSLRPKGPLDRPEEIDGAALEGLVAQHLKAWVAYRGADLDLFYWRTRSGVEVDLVLYGSEGLWGFEVKNSGRVRPEDLRGLSAFGDEYPEARRVLLYRGTERLMIDGVLCLPVADFLARLRPTQDLEHAAELSGQPRPHS